MTSVPRIYIAPNGLDVVNIYSDGYVECTGHMTMEDVERLGEMSTQAASTLELQGLLNPTVEQVFELMGWREIQPGSIKWKM